MSAARVYLQGVDVTAHIDQEDWPDWLETSMKGPGFFDWEVKRFEFRLLTRCPVAPAYGQSIRVEINGVERFRGVVFDQEDEFSTAPLVVCQPTAYTLNTVRAGESGLDEAGTSLRYLFEIPEPGLHLQEALELLLSRYDTNKDPRLEPAGTWTVVVHPSEDAFTRVFAPRGFTGPALDVAHYDPLDIAVPPGAEATTVPAEEWVQVRMGAVAPVIGRFDPVWDNAGRITERYRVTQNFIAPPGQNFVGWRPLDGGFPPYLSLAEWRALPLLAWGSERVDPDAAVRYTRHALGLPSDYAVSALGSIDQWASQPVAWSFVLVDGCIYATWWSEPSTDRIAGRWINDTMGTLLKQFLIVTGHWAKIEGTTVTATSRTATTGEIELPPLDLATDRDRQRVAQDPGSISIPIRESADPESTGFSIPASLLTAINWWYVDRFAGRQTVETSATWPTSLLPDGTTLLAGSGLGSLRNLDWSLDGTSWRIVAIEEGQ